MPVRPSPTVRARRLRYALRRLREERGLTIEQLVELSGGDWSASTISRWETGDRRIRPIDLRVLLDVYEIGGEQREAMLTLAREARQKGWWHSHSAVIPEWFEVFIGLESEASSIRVYEAELVHGLVQTPDYYRAFLRAAPAAAGDDAIERKIAVRTARQERLTSDEPPEYWAVFNEAVIRRIVGGGQTMRSQLHHVAEMAALPHVNVQVLPYRAGAHPAMDGSFEILGFPDAGDRSVVYLENQVGSLYMETTPEIERYTLMFHHLVAKALDPDESRALIAEVAHEVD
jgi:transcriptional regulator with XRE-family HTH domain